MADRTKSTCDLVLSCPEVSRVHGRITYSNAAYHFVDIGSSSGSMLNGAWVPINEQRQLGLGDLLQLGKTLLYVEAIAPPIESPNAIEKSDEFWHPLRCKLDKG